MLWLTSSGPFKHFDSIVEAFDPKGQTTDVCSDTGFADNLRDCDEWMSSSRQVGHFLSAVDTAYSTNGGFMGAVCVIGHENVADGTSSTLYQCSTTTREQRVAFFNAVEAEENCDYVLRDQYIAQILPELPENFNGDSYPGREGNSRQDVRLTVKGWVFGLKVRHLELTSIADASNWLHQKLR